MFVIFCFFFLDAAHNQREIPTFCRSFPVDLVFQSCSHMGGKEAAATKADSKVLWVILESREKNQNGVSGLEIATDTVANATNIFSLATKNSDLVAKVATRFLYILDLN